jgi:type III pantothenate kinase
MPRNNVPDTIAIDIGNTCLHAGAVDTARHVCCRREDLPLSEHPARWSQLLDGVTAPAIAGGPQMLRAVIAGGRPGMVRTVRALLRKSDVTAIEHLAWHPGLPVRFRYKNPHLLGPDRIADALYAAAAYPRRNVIIIDAGTAVTVDALTADGEFIGGVIFPGPATQLRSLHAAAPALPLLDISKRRSPLPGTSTEACMQAGVFHAMAGGLDHLIKKYDRLLGGNCTVIATGGAWAAVEPLVEFKYLEKPDMTIIGAALYHEAER